MWYYRIFARYLSSTWSSFCIYFVCKLQFAFKQKQNKNPWHESCPFRWRDAFTLIECSVGIWTIHGGRTQKATKSNRLSKWEEQGFAKAAPRLQQCWMERKKSRAQIILYKYDIDILGSHKLCVTWCRSIAFSRCIVVAVQCVCQHFENCTTTVVREHISSSTKLQSGWYSWNSSISIFFLSSSSSHLFFTSFFSLAFHLNFSLAPYPSFRRWHRYWRLCIYIQGIFLTFSSV